MHCKKSLKTAKILRAAFLFSFVCRSRYKYWFRMKFAAQQTHTHTHRTSAPADEWCGSRNERRNILLISAAGAASSISYTYKTFLIKFFGTCSILRRSHPDIKSLLHHLLVAHHRLSWDGWSSAQSECHILAWCGRMPTDIYIKHIIFEWRR